MQSENLSAKACDQKSQNLQVSTDKLVNTIEDNNDQKAKYGRVTQDWEESNFYRFLTVASDSQVASKAHIGTGGGMQDGAEMMSETTSKDNENL